MKKIKLTWEISQRKDETKVEYCFKACDVNVSSASRCIRSDLNR